MNGAIDNFLHLLEDQAWSTALRESIWIYPIVEGVHVLTIALFVGFAVMLDLRLLGVFMKQLPVSQVARSFLPRTHIAFVVMLLSGGLLFYAKPIETTYNIFFQVKGLVFILAMVNIYWYHQLISRDISAWDQQAKPPLNARLSGLISIVCWFSIVACGRLIAYKWF